MKKLILFFLVTISSFLFPQSDSQDGFYTWITHSTHELTFVKGKPGQIGQNNVGDSMYVYQIESGYSGFFYKNDIIFSTDNTTYWKTKSKAKSAFNYLLDLYKKDGFTVSSNKKDTLVVQNEKYSIKLKILYYDNWYSVSETAILLKKAGTL
jgi:hypothetical protein